MGDKNPKTTHKQAIQKQTKTDDTKRKKLADEAAKHPPKPKS